MSYQATVETIVNAVAATLSDDDWVTYRPDEMLDGIFDLPCMFVYPEMGDYNLGANHSYTFQGKAQVSPLTIHADVIAARRNWAFENVPKMIEMVDAVRDKLGAIETKPFFGVDTIQAFNWSWQRVVWERIEQESFVYLGFRVVLNMRVMGKVT